MKLAWSIQIGPKILRRIDLPKNLVGAGRGGTALLASGLAGLCAARDRECVPCLASGWHGPQSVADVIDRCRSEEHWHLRVFCADLYPAHCRAKHYGYLDPAAARSTVDGIEPAEDCGRNVRVGYWYVGHSSF
jgi:hypothetical protein